MNGERGNQKAGHPDRKKILIVDDEPNVRRLLNALLSKRFNIVEAENGEQAIEKAGVERPDLILMDIMMPKMDGYTSCYTIKKEPSTRSIPVIMLTAIDLKLNLQLSREIGADGYITKPFNSKDLISSISRILPSEQEFTPPKKPKKKRTKVSSSSTRRK